MAQVTSVGTLKEQRDTIAARAAHSCDPYLITLSTMLQDKTVFKALSEKLETSTLDGAVMKQSEPIAIIEFVFKSRSGVSLVKQCMLVGMLPESREVSLDIEKLINSREGQMAMLPLTAYIESRAQFTDADFPASDPASVEKEDRFRRRIGSPSLAEVVARFTGRETLPRRGGLEWGAFFDVGDTDLLWGRTGAAAPGGQVYTRCLHCTGGPDCPDGYMTYDDCG